MIYRRRTARDIEHIAEHFISECDRQSSDGDQILLEQVLEERGHYVFAVAGLAARTPGFLPLEGQIIYVDEQMMMTRPHDYRFTLAEGLAHSLIHRPYFESWNAAEIREYLAELSEEAYANYEHEARYLAACILMPGRAFTERMQRFKEVIEGLEGDRHMEQEILFSMLSRNFNVAPKAAERRCHELLRLGKPRRSKQGVHRHSTKKLFS